MGSVVDSLFGGGSKKAAAIQVAHTEKAMDQYRADVTQAKSEMTKFSDEAKMMRLQRVQQAQAVMQDMFKPMMQAYTQGNMNAQNILGGAGQQMQNAILGGPVDYSGLQPQGLGVNIDELLSGMGKYRDMVGDSGTSNQGPQQWYGPQQSQMDWRTADLLGGFAGLGANNKSSLKRVK